jgi:UDP-N-acetylglucosamine acyltransferase
MLVDGNPLAVRGFNTIGLKRRGYDAEQLAAIKQMHRFLYRQGKTLDEARQAIRELAAQMPSAAADVALMDAFLADATRGIAR